VVCRVRAVWVEFRQLSGLLCNRADDVWGVLSDKVVSEVTAKMNVIMEKHL